MNWNLWEMVRTPVTFPATPGLIDPTSGILDETAKVAPLIQTTPSDPSLERHFSAFALTSHLHSPVLRLVSLHPSLSVSVSFLRIPEIHDGFTWKCFFSRTTSVGDVVDSILDTLGLSRSLPVPGAGTVRYVLEEVWVEGDTESEFHVAPSNLSAQSCFKLLQELRHFLRTSSFMTCSIPLTSHQPFPRMQGITSGSRSQTSGTVAHGHALHLPCHSNHRNLRQRKVEM